MQQPIDLDKRFDYHEPSIGRVARHEDLRAAMKTTAKIILELVPQGREQSLAITALEESMMWANAGIARGE